MARSAARPLSLDEIRTLPVVLDVETAAHLLGMGRNAAYQLLADERFPCPANRPSGTWRIPTAGVLAYLGIDVTAVWRSPADRSQPTHRPR